MSFSILIGDCIERMRELPAESMDCCVTSPPYWGLRDYKAARQIGLEKTPEEYVARIAAVFHEARRVLRDDGTLWLNLGDTFYSSPSGQNGMAGTLDGGKPCDGAGTTTDRIPRPSHPTLKTKDLVGIPWRVAFALQADGWWLRSDIVWSKPNVMPESVTDRPTKAHEYVFLLSKSERYYFDAEAIREPDVGSDHRRSKLDGQPSLEPSGGLRPPNRGIRTVGGRNGKGRNARTVWSIATKPFAGAHFATMPPALAERCIRAGSRIGGAVLDPFGGAGTTALVATQLGRNATIIELNPEYAKMAEARISGAPAPPAEAPTDLSEPAARRAYFQKMPVDCSGLFR